MVYFLLSYISFSVYKVCSYINVSIIIFVHTFTTFLLHYIPLPYYFTSLSAVIISNSSSIACLLIATSSVLVKVDSNVSVRPCLLSDISLVFVSILVCCSESVCLHPLISAVL